MNNLYLSYIYLVVYNTVTFNTISGSDLKAVSLAPFSLNLYQKLANNKPPSGRDPGILSAAHRERVCEDIGEMGLFDLGYRPVNQKELYRKRNEASYSPVFRSIYSRTPPFRYENPYRSLVFTFEYINVVYEVEEYVFVCPFSDLFSRIPRVVILYVSKEYNVHTIGQPYMPGRFILGHFLGTEDKADTEVVMLAEEPARAHVKPGFNVELHYLQMKKNNNHQLAVNNAMDPLCKLVLEQLDDPDNQHTRLCMAVFSSSYFIDKLCHYAPLPASTHECSVEEVTFRTYNGMKAAAGKTYYERMTLCYANMVYSASKECFAYVSRAYKSNEVFVYLRDGSDKKIYLENLSTNMKIVEFTSFDYIED